MEMNTFLGNFGPIDNQFQQFGAYLLPQTYSHTLSNVLDVVQALILYPVLYVVIYKFIVE